MPNTEPRERVAAAIYSGPLQQDDNFSAADAVGTIYRDEYWVNPTQFALDIADEALAAHNAWLWERADDPEVIEAVAIVEHAELRLGLPPRSWDDEDEGIRNATRAMVRGNATRLLTALIGPRPGNEVE